jgi:hypothetical protein
MSQSGAYLKNTIPPLDPGVACPSLIDFYTAFLNPRGTSWQYRTWFSGHQYKPVPVLGVSYRIIFP